MIKSLARVLVEGMEPEHQPTKVAFIPNSGVVTCGPGCRETVGVFGIGCFHSSEGSIVILGDSVVYRQRMALIWNIYLPSGEDFRVRAYDSTWMESHRHLIGPQPNTRAVI